MVTRRAGDPTRRRLTMRRSQPSTLLMRISFMHVLDVKVVGR